MGEITAKDVKVLRDATHVSMMECKKALQEADGDMDRAMTLLRERGMAVAAKKATRTAKDGKVAARVSEDGSRAAMIEVNCETDFVTRNEKFQAFVEELSEKALDAEDDSLAEKVKDDLTARIAEIGENLVVRRNVRFELQGTGLLASYVHLGGKVGVLLEMGCEKPETASADAFRELARDLTLHVAATDPEALSREDVPQEKVDAEREIFKKQVEGKPEHIIEKIVEGKVDKFYSQICLLEQGFVKDDKISVTELMKQKGGEVGDTFSIRRYARYQLGGE
ncbi:translation elongation factor Ts [Kiritimatiella glycovorans]|uniref:Elongation factor Ts n=1 Tax=Kiritimatiella glycovorans TaxID=1307763 RepID=A0A0G3EHH0_9BACT|nr:translation elongation factor Ts [Kiritimatiella glycovorans]AKJ63624.1 Elongation factor Ts [Kiritimatiella glycovorans]